MTDEVELVALRQGTPRAAARGMRSFSSLRRRARVGALSQRDNCHPVAHPSMSLEEIAADLVAAGCPADKSMEMARQLDKRAQQLAAQKGQTYGQALRHLLALMQQGWAAQQTRPRE